MTTYWLVVGVDISTGGHNEADDLIFVEDICRTEAQAIQRMQELLMGTDGSIARMVVPIRPTYFRIDDAINQWIESRERRPMRELRQVSSPSQLVMNQPEDQIVQRLVESFRRIGVAIDQARMAANPPSDQTPLPIEPKPRDNPPRGRKLKV